MPRDTVGGWQGGHRRLLAMEINGKLSRPQSETKGWTRNIDILKKEGQSRKKSGRKLGPLGPLGYSCALTEIVLDILVSLELSEVGNGVLSADETVVVNGRHAQEFRASPAVNDRPSAGAPGSTPTSDQARHGSDAAAGTDGGRRAGCDDVVFTVQD